MSTIVLNSALGYAFWLLAAQWFNPTQIGAASGVVSAATVASTVAEVGLRTTLMEVLPGRFSDQRWSAVVSTALVVGSLTSLVGGSAAIVALHLASPEMGSFLYGAWSLGVVSLTVTLTVLLVLDGVSCAERSTGQLLSRSLVISVSKIVFLGVVLCALPHRPQVILVAIGAGLFAGAVYGMRWQLRSLVDNWHFVVRGFPKVLRSMRGSMAGHYLINTGGFLPTYILPLEVVTRLSTAQNAYFTFTWMLGTIFFMVSSSVAGSMFVQGRWSPGLLSSLTRRAIILITLLLLPAALLLVIFGRFALGLFGSSYATQGYPVLIILVVSSIPDAVTNVRCGQLRAQRRLLEAGILNSSMGIVAVVSAWMFLPLLGIRGAALAWLVGQSAGAIWVVVDAGASAALRHGRGRKGHREFFGG